MSDKGNCPKHGEFTLTEGCAQCLADDAKVNSPENIAKRIKESEENLPPAILSPGIGGQRYHLGEPGGLAEAARAAGAGDLPDYPHLVKVQYISLTTGEISDRDYTYYSVDRLDVGDIITVPIRGTSGKARVTAIDVPEAEIATYKDKVKTIPTDSRLGKADCGDVVVAELRVNPELEEGVNSEGGLILLAPDPNARRTGEEEESAEKQSGPGGPGANTYGAKPETVADAALVEIDEQGNLVPKAETAVVLSPGEDLEVRGYSHEALKLLEKAESRVIATLEDNKAATDDLAIISKLKKAMEAKKREYLDPLKAQAEAIRETYTYLMAPILEAKQVTEKKMLAYNAEQDHIRREQQEINRKLLEVAQAEARLKGEVTEPLNLVAVEPEVTKKVSTEMGTSSQRDNWKYDVVDLDTLPREYMIPDEPMLNAIAKKHHDQKKIPGVRFYNEPIIATRAR